MKRLGDKRLKEMKQENEKLFELMNMERKASLSVVESKLVWPNESGFIFFNLEFHFPSS